MRRLRAVGVAAVLLLVVVACGGDEPQTASTPTIPAGAGALEPSEPFGLTTVELRAPQGATSLSIPVYDAFDARTRQRGLMGREHLPERAGMVFRFPQDHRGGFWMKDTLIPLSIAFFDADGIVVSVLDMDPCEAEPCESYTPGVEYRGALEVNQGFFERIGLKTGWRLELPFGLPPAS